MKIKKFKNILNENNPFDIEKGDDNIIVKATYYGEFEIPLSEIKETDYYFDNYGNNNKDEIDNNIYYSIDQVMRDQGITPYDYKLYDENGKEVNIDFYLKQINYNL